MDLLQHPYEKRYIVSLQTIQSMVENYVPEWRWREYMRDFEQKRIDDDITILLDHHLIPTFRKREIHPAVIHYYADENKIIREEALVAKTSRVTDELDIDPTTDSLYYVYRRNGEEFIRWFRSEHRHLGME